MEFLILNKNNNHLDYTNNFNFSFNLNENLKILSTKKVSSYNIKNKKILFFGIIEGYYLNGKLNGLTVNYDPHWGKFMKSELRYLNGEQHGIQRYYWFNGILAKEYSLKNGKKEGVYKEFDSKGRLRIERNYERGKLEGRELEFTFYRNDALRIPNEKMGKNTVYTGSGI